MTDHLLGDSIALPVNITSRATDIAHSKGIKVLTTKLSAPALMDAANEPGVGFAASGDGGFILPGFLPAFDAAATFVKVLDLMARSCSAPLIRRRRPASRRTSRTRRS